MVYLCKSVKSGFGSFFFCGDLSNDLCNGEFFAVTFCDLLVICGYTGGRGLLTISGYLVFETACGFFDPIFQETYN